MWGSDSLVIPDKMLSTDQAIHFIIVWFALLLTDVIADQASTIEFRRTSEEIFSMALFALWICVIVTNKAVRLYLHWFGNRVLPEDKSWFLSVANPTAANGRCIVGNLPNRVPDLPEFHSIGLQSDNLPVEKLARSALLDANSSEKLNQLGISCKISLHNRSLGDPCHLLQRCELWVGSSTFPSCKVEPTGCETLRSPTRSRRLTDGVRPSARRSKAEEELLSSTSLFYY